MKIKKKDTPKNRVYIECSETTRRVKATVLNYSEQEIDVEMPTGFRMIMKKRGRRHPYVWRIGMMEFLSDGKLIN